MRAEEREREAETARAGRPAMAADGAIASGGEPAASAGMRTSQAVSMAVCVAFGFVYFAWVAFTEGWRFWLVASLVAAFGAAGFVAHRVMRAGRK
jgi:hypothetical protein